MNHPSSQQTNEQWHDFLRDGKESNFEHVFATTQHAVWSICAAILGNEEDASDAFQGAYTRLVVLQRDAPRTLQEMDPLPAMRRLAVWEADRLRKKRARLRGREIALKFIPDQNPGTDPSPAATAAARELREKVETLLVALPDRERTAVAMSLLHGMTHEEIAEALQAPRTTITSRIQKGTERLKGLLRRAGIRDAEAALAGIAGTAALATAPKALSASVVYTSALAAAATTTTGGTALLTGIAIMETKKVITITAVVLLLLIAVVSYQKFSSDRAAGKKTAAMMDARKVGTQGTGDKNGSANGSEPKAATEFNVVASVSPEATPEAAASPDETLRDALKSPAIIIRGKVYMPDKSLAKNAPVVLQRQLETYPTGYGGAGQPSETIVTNLDSTQTDVGGRYEVGAPGLESLVLLVHAPDTATAFLTIRPKNVTLIRRKDGVLVATMDVRLTKPARYHGIVMNEEEKPVADAQILGHYEVVDWGETNSSAGETASVTSGADGKFSFDQFSVESVSMTAQKAGYAPTVVRARASDNDVKIVLKKGGAVVAGKVLLLQKNTPVEHAQVQLFARNPVNMNNPNPLKFTTESDAKGAFRIENIPAGNYMLLARTPQLQMVSSNMLRVPDFGLTEKEKRDDFVLYLGAGTTFRGKVTDRITHMPIPGANVHAEGVFDTQTLPSTTTDDKGDYVLENVYGQLSYQGTREAVLVASKTGYATTMRTWKEQSVSPSSGQTDATQNLDLRRTVLVSGRVVTPQNAPVVGARVTDGRRGVVEPTDPLGRFTIPMITNYKAQIEAHAQDFAITYSAPIDVKEQPIKDLVVVMNPGATVVAHVIDPDKKSVAGASVWIMVRTFADYGSGALINEMGKTNSAGIFTFTHVPTKDYPIPITMTSIQPALGALADGYAESKEVKPELRSNEAIGVTIPLREKMKHFAAGIIRDQNGDPLQGVRIQSWGSDLSADTSTAAGGTFRIEGLGEPPYEFQLFHADYGTDTLLVAEADRTDVEFVMGKKQALLTCIVTDANSGEPISESRCERLVEGGAMGEIQQPSKVTGTPGAFRIQRAITGEPYTFRVSSTGYETNTTTVTIPEGQKEFIQVIELKKSAISATPQ